MQLSLETHSPQQIVEYKVTFYRELGGYMHAYPSASTEVHAYMG